MSHRVFRAAGSVPPGEDRALYQILRRADARIVHARDVEVVVSGRTWRARMAAWRTRSGGAVRRGFGASAAPPDAFSAAWTTLDATLPRGRVAVADRAAGMAAAAALRDRLLAAQTVTALPMTA